MKLNFPTVLAMHPSWSVVGQADLKTDQRPVTLVDGLTTTNSLGEPLKGRSNFLINSFPNIPYDSTPLRIAGCTTGDVRTW